MSDVLRPPKEFDMPRGHFEARRKHLVGELLQARPTSGRLSGFRRRRLALPLAIVGAAVAAAAAGAATGVLHVGDLLPAPSLGGKDEPRYTSQRVVVATGTAPALGRWEMTLTASDDGPCVGLRLIDRVPPGARGPDLFEGCGDRSSFTVGRVGGGSGAGRNEYLVHGRAPEEAQAVRLTAERGVEITAPTHEGPTDVPGDFYLLVTPPDLKNALVTWIDKDGNEHGPGLSVPGTIQYER